MKSRDRLTMTLDEAKARYEAALNARTARLVAEIQRVMTARPFVLDAGATQAAINGIHFEYAWGTFVPVACPLNTSTGYCGRGERLTLLADGERGVFPAAIDAAVLAAAPDDPETMQDTLDALKTALYFGWFSGAWKLARNANPAMRGFLSIHDSLWRTDLDTGEKFREDAGPVRFY